MRGTSSGIRKGLVYSKSATTRESQGRPEKEMTYHDFIHTSLDTRINLTSTRICRYTADGHMPSDFLQLLELANLPSTSQAIHNRHLNVEQDD